MPVLTNSKLLLRSNNQHEMQGPRNTCSTHNNSNSSRITTTTQTTINNMKYPENSL
jgi:hypothetical protein